MHCTLLNDDDCWDIIVTGIEQDSLADALLVCHSMNDKIICRVLIYTQMIIRIQRSYRGYSSRARMIIHSIFFTYDPVLDDIWNSGNTWDTYGVQWFLPNHKTRRKVENARRTIRGAFEANGTRHVLGDSPMHAWIKKRHGAVNSKDLFRSVILKNTLFFPIIEHLPGDKHLCKKHQN